MIERSKEFALVPWRNVLEKQRHQRVAGVLKGRDVIWSLGLKRNAPER